MRVRSLIILLLILGGIAFVFIHEPTRTKVFGQIKEWRFQSNGYAKAKTPREAMNGFEKAIKARDYEAAARYCSGDYAKLLLKAHEAAHAMGTRLDKIYNELQGKDLRTPMAMELLLGMDPFQDTFKVKDVVEEKKGDTARGSFEFDPKPASTGRSLNINDLNRLDLNIFRANALVPGCGPAIFFRANGFEIKKEGDYWKIFFPLNPDPTRDVNTVATNYFIDKHVRYLGALDNYHDNLKRDSTTRDNTGPELLETLARSK